MLSVYLVPKRHHLYQPSAPHLITWLKSVHQSGLLIVPERLVDVSCNEEELVSRLEHQLNQDFTLELFPGIAISYLYHQHAHEALVPAELSLESIKVNIASFPTLLPLDEVESEAACPECGDPIPNPEVEKAISKLDLFPLPSIKVFCLSCQDERDLRSLNFTPPMSFSQFWLQLQQSASTRLNSQVIKAWESSLGCLFDQLNDQRDELRTDAELPALFAGEDQGSAMGRDHFRAERWNRRRQGKRSSKRRSSKHR